MQTDPTLLGPAMLWLVASICMAPQQCWHFLALVAYNLKPVKRLGPCKRTQHCWPTTPNNVGSCWHLLRPFAWASRDVSFFMRRGGGGLKIFWGGHIFSEPKKGGHIFFQSLILNIYFLKGMQYQKSECKLYYWATVCFSFKYGLAKILFNTIATHWVQDTRTHITSTTSS